MTTFKNLSASGLRQAELCPASYALPVSPEANLRGGGSAAARRGTYIHAIFEAKMKNASEEDALAFGEKVNGGRPHHTWKAWALSHDPHDLLPPGYSWVPETRWGADFSGLRVDGTPDVVGFGSKGRGLVVDWKTTSEPRDLSSIPAAWQAAAIANAEEKAARHKLQALFHAVVMYETTQAKNILTDVIYVGPRSQIFGSSSSAVTAANVGKVRRRLELVSERVQEARKGPGPGHFTTSGSCKYCDSISKCQVGKTYIGGLS